MFNKYYHEELTFLRELGKEFAEAHPEAAHYLSAKGSDPEVDRLLEGFAFLTGRIRHKLDDELPELTHMLIGLLWPHYLRPIPAMSILQCKPKEHLLSDHQVISRGTEVASVAVEGVQCRFRTCYDVDLYPLSLRQVFMENPSGKKSQLRLTCEPHQGVQLKNIKIERLRFYLHGESNVTSALFLWLSRCIKKISIRSVSGTEAPISLPPDMLCQAGFGDDEVLLPYPLHSFKGYRFLQEYFCLPEKFMFFDLYGLEKLYEAGIDNTFEILLEFDKRWDDALRVSEENILLYCTPVINLFQHEADPIRIEQERTSYRIHPHGSDIKHFEIFSVDRVNGWDQYAARERVYEPFYSFKHGQKSLGRGNVYHNTTLQSAVVGHGTDTYISFVNEEGDREAPFAEAVNIELTCSNRNLPSELRVGDIRIPTDKSPEYVEFRNILPVRNSIPPPLGGDLHWRLISHLSLNYQSLTNPDSLRRILGVYNFQALYDSQAARQSELLLEGIASVHAEPDEHIFRGAVIRGTYIRMELLEDHFAGEGEMLLFASVLNEFFTLYSSINSFCRLEVRGVQKGETYDWPPRIGQQIIL